MNGVTNKFLRFMIVVLAAPLALAALATGAYGQRGESERILQSNSVVGRYVGDNQSRQGMRTVSVALRASNVAVVLIEYPNSVTPQRDRGRWENGSTRNQIRVRLDNGDEYEFTYRNDTLTGGRVDRRTAGSNNQMTLYRIADDSDGDVPSGMREMSLTENGSGEYSTFGQRAQRFDRASVTVTQSGRAELTFENINNRPLRFVGYVTRFDNNSFRVALFRGDTGNASGTADITYVGERRITSINLTGTQGVRKFTVSFDGRGGGPGGPGGGPGGGRDLNLSERGTGFVQFGSRLREPLVQATVTVNNGRDAEITLRRANENVLRLSGRVERMGNGSMFVRLTNSGNADATGTADVQYREPGTIFSIKIDATTDRSRLTAEFRRDENTGPFPPGTPGGVVDLSQNGRGTVEMGNQGRVELTRATLSIDRNERATIELRDRNGRTYRYQGTVSSRDRGTVKINLTEFSGGLGSRSINGEATVAYGRDAITSINLSGRMNNDRFFADFTR